MGCDDVDRDLNRDAQESKFANVAKGSIVSLGGVTSRVSNEVQDSSQDPDSTEGGSWNWVLEACKHQNEQVGSKALESILVDALVAIEDVLFVIFLALFRIGVKEGQRHLGELAVAVNTCT